MLRLDQCSAVQLLPLRNIYKRSQPRMDNLMRFEVFVVPFAKVWRQYSIVYFLGWKGNYVPM